MKKLACFASLACLVLALHAQPVVLSSAYTRALGRLGIWHWTHSIGVTSAPELQAAVAAVCREFNAAFDDMGTNIEFYPTSALLAHVDIQLADVPGPAIGLSQLEVFTDGYGAISHGFITIEYRKPLQAVLLHEFMHILGFQGHLDGFASSLTGGNTNTTLTSLDYILLKAHYGP